MNKREKQKEETFADILRVSGELFQEIGYEKTSIQMIADRCGLSKGALYHHFRSKEEVLERISRNYYETALAVFLPIARDTGRSMCDRLKDIMTVARKSQMNTAAAEFAREGGSSSVENAVLEKVFDRYSEKIYDEVFAPLFEDGRQAGECNFTGSGKIIARFIHNLDSGMSRQLNEILARPEDPGASAMIGDVINVFSAALAGLLDMNESLIRRITLSDQMVEQYQRILENRLPDS